RRRQSGDGRRGGTQPNLKDSLFTCDGRTIVSNQGTPSKPPETSTPDRNPETATVAPKAIGGTLCLCQFQIRIQILPLKHVVSHQLPDGMSESLGPTVSGSIFLALARRRKRSAGLKKGRRRGCRRTAERPSFVLQF